MRCPGRRSAMLGLLVACGGSIVVAAYQGAGGGGRQGGGPDGPPVIQVEKVKENLFLFKGGGGNTAILIGADGVTVVDTKIPGWGQPIIAKIKELTDKPVIRIINSHTHYDHVSGNVEFPASVDVVAHANTKVNMERGLPPKGAESRVPPDVFKANGGKNIAKRTFKDKLTIGNGADRIDLYYFGRGHTNGDAWTVFPALRVMHAGDIFSGKLVPLLDSNNGGSGVEIPDTLAKAGNIKDIDLDHHRPQYRDDAGGPEGVLGFQPRLPQLRPRGKEGRQVSGRRGGQLEGTGEIQGLQSGAGGPGQEQRSAYLR